MRVAVIIPALDEEHTIGAVVHEVRGVLATASIDARVIVANNGSRDRTAAVARAAGADVVDEPVRGYGRACLAALARLDEGGDAAVHDAAGMGAGDTHDAILFMDGDGADDPSDALVLLAPIARGEAELVIGSRVLGERLRLVERDALTPAQRAGNALASALLRRVYGAHATDLGPFRAITRGALSRLRMDDRDFGWTVQMQARAARAGLVVVERAVHWRRRRAGRSKVSGDVRASLTAGRVILTTLWRERAWSRA